MPRVKKLSVNQAKLDVDIRFLLANERTLLAWIRTSLALMAGGLAFTQLGSPSKLKVVFGIAFIALGALMAAFGYWRFLAADKAIRAGKLPDTSRNPKLQVTAVIGFAILLVVVLLIFI